MRRIVPGLFLLACLGCSGDDDGGDLSMCMPDVPCACPGNTMQGTTVCRDDGTQSCSGCPTMPMAGTGGSSGASGGGGNSVGGSGGMSGAGGAGGMGGAGGGDGGTGMPDEDGGVDDGDGGAVSSGEQNAPCANAAECDDGLGCYVTNHCSLECDNDDDCDDLDGADYTCGQGGLCRAQCGDDDDCPNGFSCESVGGGGGGGAMRCVLP